MSEPAAESVRAPVTGKLVGLTPAEDGWKAVFGTAPGIESQSRIVAWGLLDSGEVVGLIVHPGERWRIAPAPDVVSPEGEAFDRYGFRPSGS
jgi:hypothetical protein